MVTGPQAKQAENSNDWDCVVVDDDRDPLAAMLDGPQGPSGSPAAGRPKRQRKPTEKNQK